MLKLHEESPLKTSEVLIDGRVGVYLLFAYAVIAQ